MRGRALLDTGPLVALLHAGDQDHARCQQIFQEFQGQLLTTEPVLTEAMHLLRNLRKGPRACIDFILHGGAVLVPQSRDSLSECARLLAKYADLPMDFADATLVALASELQIQQVFTLDVRDFTIYRVGRKRFEIFPS